MEEGSEAYRCFYKCSVTKTLEPLRITSFADPYRSTLKLLLFVGNSDGHDLKTSYFYMPSGTRHSGGNGRCLLGWDNAAPQQKPV